MILGLYFLLWFPIALSFGLYLNMGSAYCWYHSEAWKGSVKVYDIRKLLYRYRLSTIRLLSYTANYDGLVKLDNTTGNILRSNFVKEYL